MIVEFVKKCYFKFVIIKLIVVREENVMKRINHNVTIPKISLRVMYYEN